MREDPLAHLEKRPGIYMITNRITGERYVGQSVNVKKRCQTHRANLDGRWHKNSKLLEASRGYGQDAFEFTALEYLETPPQPEDFATYWAWREQIQSALFRREEHYVRALRPEYNIDTIPLEDGVIVSTKIERRFVDAIAQSGMRQTDFIREAVLEKLRAMSLLDS